MTRAGIAAVLSALCLSACGRGVGAEDVVPCDTCESEELRTRLRVTTAALPDAEVGVAYSASFVAAGGRQPYSWSLSGDPLPTGLSFDTLGATVSGTPVAAGAVTLTATVRDALGRTASRAVALDVIATACDAGCLCPGIDAWMSAPLGAATSGAFKVSFDASPGAAPTDMVVGLSSGAATAYTSLGVIIRFSESGFIDAMNGTTPGYQHDVAVAYEAGKNYHFTIDVDTAAHVATYYVTPEGGQQVTLGAGYGFRREQATASSFDTVSTIDSISADSTLCAVSVSSSSPQTPPPPPPPAVDDSDGFANAPSCTAQYPNLLAGYAHPPSWHVAGVHYCVGYPAGTVLKNPATIAMTGVTVDSGSRTVYVTGSNVTLDGYAFDGWGVFVQGQNTRIVNSRFSGGGTPYTHYAYGNAANLYIGYSVIDGGNISDFLVNQNYPGLTVEYCWLKNTGGDIIGRHAYSGGNLTIQYNLTEQSGMGGPETHGDYLQIYGPTIDKTVVRYNTSRQVNGITQGWIADTSKSGEIGNNVFIGDASYWISIDTNELTGQFTAHDNYFDIGGYGFCYPHAAAGDSYPLTVFTHNVDMRTGEVIED